MMRIFLLVVVLPLLAGCNDDGDPSASTQTSPDGIDYTLIRLPENPDVSIQLAWPTDWAYRDDTNKAAPLVGTELILAGGAEGYPAGEAGELFADLNSEAELYAAGGTHLIAELSFERDVLSETVAIANAHLRAPTLDDAWFDRVRNSIAQNMHEARSQPAHAGFDAARWAIFGDAPFRNALSLDAPGTFEDLTRNDIADWHSKTITIEPDAVVVAGDIDAAAAGNAVDALLDGLPQSDRDHTHDISPDYAPRRILLHKPQAQVTTLAMIAPLPPTSEGSELEDLLLVGALGGGDQSVLFDAVRTQARASYGFGAGIANYSRDQRFLFMTGEVETEKLADIENIVRDAYAAFRQTGPTGELSDRKAPLADGFADMPNFVADQARSELQSALDGFAASRSLELGQELDTVTDTSIMERLNGDFPEPDDFIVIAVSPDADALPVTCVIDAPKEAAECP